MKINYISTEATIPNINKCSDSPKSFELTEKTTTIIEAEETVKLSSPSNLELQCIIKYKTNIEKTTKNFLNVLIREFKVNKDLNLI